MKKITKLLFIFIIAILLGGCFNKDDMEEITIYTTSYPIEYIINRLYEENSTVKNIYPNGVNINDYKITTTLLRNYNDVDLYVFNGLSNEKNYINTLKKVNPNIKVIDSTNSLKYENSIDELWLDPSKVLTLANNIKKGFDEYITKTYLINEIDENYENLKIDLTNLDAKYRSSVKKATNKTIIVSSNAYLYLKKYNLEVISLDESTVTEKDIITAKNLLNNNNDYIFIAKGEKLSDTIKQVISDTKASTLELNTLANLTDDEKDKYDYLSLSSQNLETLKEEIYK